MRSVPVGLLVSCAGRGYEYWCCAVQRGAVVDRLLWTDLLQRQKQASKHARQGEAGEGEGEGKAAHQKGEALASNFPSFRQGQGQQQGLEETKRGQG